MSGSTREVSGGGDTSDRRIVPMLAWGIIAGLLAGVVFIALTMWLTASMGNPALTPLRVIATIVEGPPPPEATIWVGVVVHFVLSALFGLVFAAAVAMLRDRSAGRSWAAAVLWGGLIYGGLLYLVNFQLLARLVPQFAAFLGVNQPFEVTVHLLFGALLAAFLVVGPEARRRSPDGSRPGA